MPEWFKGTVLKTVVRFGVPWVRIPPPPPIPQCPWGSWEAQSVPSPSVSAAMGPNWGHLTSASVRTHGERTMDVRERVDPAYRSLVEAAAASAVDPNDWLSSPEKVRADRAALLPPPPVPDEIDYTDHDAPGPKGEPAVTVRTYRARGAAGAQPAIYWIHGGRLCGRYVRRCERRLRRMGDGLRCDRCLAGLSPRPRAPLPGRDRGLLRRSALVDLERRLARDRPEPGDHRWR